MLRKVAFLGLAAETAVASDWTSLALSARADGSELTTCSGSGDPTHGCYEGTAGPFFAKETIKVHVAKFANGVGSMDLTGSGVLGFTCSEHSFTKSGQAVSVDLSDCLPAGVSVPSVNYCSDSDTVAVTVKVDAVGMSLPATLKKVSCGMSNEIEFATCTGSAEPPSGTCYEGRAGAMGLTEDIKVNLKSFSGGRGTIDLSSSGLPGTIDKGFACKDHSFSKAGQEISVDASDCMPAGFKVSDVKYCSDTESVKVTVQGDSGPLGFFPHLSAMLNRVDCAGSANSELASCSGSGDPTPGCYRGSAGPFFAKETITVKIDKFVNGVGSMHLTGSRLLAFTCGERSFTKSGQAISLDLNDCLPSGVSVPSVSYCSNTDTVNVMVSVDALKMNVPVTLKKVSCDTGLVVV